MEARADCFLGEWAQPCKTVFVLIHSKQLFKEWYTDNHFFVIYLWLCMCACLLIYIWMVANSNLVSHWGGGGGGHF